jgi:hypothetical protein
MIFNRNKNRQTGHIIFNEKGILSGSLSYTDVPKYVSALGQMKAADPALFELTLKQLLDTGHPVAIAFKLEHCIENNAPRGEIDFLTEQLKAKAFDNDSDAMVNWASKVLVKTIPGDEDLALGMMQQLAERGFPHLTAHAAVYYLQRINDGDGDHQENNRLLSYWLKTCRPKDYKKWEKGKLEQRELIRLVLSDAGFQLL